MSPSRDPGDDLESLETLYQLPSAARRGRASMSWAAWRAIAAGAALIAVISWLAWSGMHHDDTLNLLKGLPRDGVVAADDGAPHTGGPWLVTSGTLLTSDGALWTGTIDGDPPDGTAAHTGSAVLRAVTTRRDFADATVKLQMKVAGLTTTDRTPAHAWDGVHIFLRYGSPDDLYVADLTRRDGALTIKRKATPAGAQSNTPDTSSLDGGAYTILATTRFPGGMSGWHDYEVGIRTTPTGPAITVSVDGHTVLTALDDSPDALHAAGAVGIRGDNAEFSIRSMTVTAPS